MMTMEQLWLVTHTCFPSSSALCLQSFQLQASRGFLSANSVEGALVDEPRISGKGGFTRPD